MSEPAFTRADLVIHRDDLLELNVEYLSWVFGEIAQMFGVPTAKVVGMPVEQYVPTVIDKICGEPAPKGAFYLVYLDGELAGMGGLRYLRKGVAEIKRIYVRPAYRGIKLGQRILERILADAASFGYGMLYLDTGPFMTSAQHMYEAQGFVDCPAYEGVELPLEFQGRFRFMRRTHFGHRKADED